MPILGKIGQALGQMGRFYTSPEGLQNLQATLQDIANPDTQAMARLQMRRDKLAQQKQQQQAYADLMASYRGPDMETAGVNELIGGANETGAGFGMAPMQRQEPRYQQGFDPAAIGTFLGQGGSAADAKAMQDLMNPRPGAVKVATPGDGTVLTVDEDGNPTVVYSSPVLQDRVRAQTGSYNAQAGQRTQQGKAAMIRATNSPGPRTGARGANTPRPTGKVY